MHRGKSNIPQHRRHKGKNLGYVRIDGRMCYTGKWGTAEAEEKAQRLVRRHLAGLHGERTGSPDWPGDETIEGLSAKYWRYFEAAYQDSREPESLRYALRALVRLFGDHVVEEFRPRHLKVLRQTMIEDGLGRTTINARIGKLKRMFRWGVEEELVSPSTADAIRAVENLKPGRSPAREPVPVEPVEQSVVEATIPRVSPQVAAMIRLQWLTGMRPGEVVRMRLDEIDQAEEIWVYAPSQHKNLHRGHDRIIALGPKCQEVLEPFLQRSSEDYLFSPREADIEWRRKKRALRRSKITPSQRLREQRAARRARTRLGHHYDVRAYARAIARACKQAGLQHWSPNQLRHAAATRFRKEFDGDSARALLGHRSLRVTEIYAKIDYSKALRVMREIG